MVQYEIQICIYTIRINSYSDDNMRAITANKINKKLYNKNWIPRLLAQKIKLIGNDGN